MLYKSHSSVALRWIQDFPHGGIDPLGGHQPTTWVLFDENVCKNERIRSNGGHVLDTPPRSANFSLSKNVHVCCEEIRVTKIFGISIK